MAHMDSRPTSGGPARERARLMGLGLRVAGVSALVMTTGCFESTGDRVLGLDATGTVTATIRSDATGNGQLDASDTGVPGVHVLLRFVGTEHVLVSEPSDADGVIEMRDVPVGSYSVEINTTAVEDSLGVVATTHSQIILAADAQIDVGVLLSYPMLTIDEARNAPVGQRVFVDGVVLNARTNFGDNTIHLASPSMAIRLTRPGAVNVAPGDSVRVLGRRDMMDGQPTLDQVSVLGLGPGTMPVARILASGVAASADSGSRDAALVRVTGATIMQRTPTETGYELQVEDGSGPLTVRLDAVTPFPVQQYLEGAVLDVRGVLVPTGQGDWAMRPRVVADVVIVAPPPTSSQGANP
jgi:hypothetical protein